MFHELWRYTCVIVRVPYTATMCARLCVCVRRCAFNTANGPATPHLCWGHVAACVLVFVVGDVSDPDTPSVTFVGARARARAHTHTHTASQGACGCDEPDARPPVHRQLGLQVRNVTCVYMHASMHARASGPRSLRTGLRVRLCQDAYMYTYMYA